MVVISQKRNELDPVLAFGMHKGEKLSSVPIDYLQWVVTQDKYNLKHTRDWPALAKAELERRAEEEELPEGMEFVEAGTIQVKLKKSTPPILTTQAIDGAAKGMLRDFVLRNDQNQTFSNWIQKVGQEALQYGTHTKQAATGSYLTYSYMGNLFTFTIANENTGQTRLENIERIE